MKVIHVMDAKVGSILVLAKDLMMETILPLSTSIQISGEKSKGLVVKTSHVENLNFQEKEVSLEKLRKNSKILPSNVGVNLSPNTSHIIAQLMEVSALVKTVMSFMELRMYHKLNV